MFTAHLLNSRRMAIAQLLKSKMASENLSKGTKLSTSSEMLTNLMRFSSSSITSTNQMKFPKGSKTSTDPKATINKNGVIWRKAMKDCLTVSCDGSVKKDLGPNPQPTVSGSSYVVRNDVPEWMVAAHIKNPETYDVEEAEATGVINGLNKVLELATLKEKFMKGDDWVNGLEEKKKIQYLELKKKLQMGTKWKGVTVQTDCMRVIQRVKQGGKVKCPYVSKVFYIRKLMTKVEIDFGHCKLDHVYDVANGVAHHLSRLQLDDDQVFYSPSEVACKKSRSFINNKWNKDKNGTRHKWGQK